MPAVETPPLPSLPAHRSQRRLRLLVVVGVAHVVLACGDHPSTNGGLSTTDSAGVRITTIGAASVQAMPEWRLAETPDHVFDAATTADSTAFALIGPVRLLSGGTVVIADLGANRLHVYDSAGAYQGALGRHGQGPAEFATITSVTPMRADSLAVFDASQRRLTVWSASRGYVRQVGLHDGGSLEAWPSDAWPWRDSLVVVLEVGITPRPALASGETTKRWPMRAQLALRDNAGRVITASPAFEGTYTALFSNGDARAPFSHNPFAAVAGERVVYGSGGRFQIKTLGAAFTTDGEIRAPVLDEPFDRSEATRLYDETLALISARMPAAAARARLASSFDPAILPDRRPSIGRVLVDDQGRLWVERFEPMRLGSQLQVPGARWTVLAADGRPVARLQLPPRTRLEAVRGDRVAVVRWDELDTQSVAIHALRR
jgi:hypothetical protein